MIALIDADILVYEAAHRSQHSVEWEPGEFTHAASLPEAQADFAGTVESICGIVEADSAILALTDSDREKNFRRKVWPGYKNTREAPGGGRPLLFKALRQWIREEYNVNQKEGIEGDDTLGILATLPGEDLEPCVICSVDKDMDTVPGLHYNWRKPELGVYEVDRWGAFEFFMEQTLTGDSTDGYPGLPGCGPKGADKLLRDDSLAWLRYETFTGYQMGLWAVVVGAYEKKGLTAEDALIQARCARILQACDWDFEKSEPILWVPPSEGE